MTPQAIRQIIKDFQSDWVPTGQHGDVKAVKNVRPATGLERCCACCGNDIQSGPMYCGDLADIVADVANMPGCIVALCDRHKGRMKAFPVEEGKS